MQHKTKKKAAPGFYDTSDEQARITTAPVGQSLRRLENKRKPDDEEAERRKRQRKGKDEAPHQTKFVPAREAQIQKLKEAESIGRRRKLELPAAQVGEAELEDIVKIGQAGEHAKLLVAGGGDASGRLLSDYECLERAKMTRTPRTAPQREFPPLSLRLTNWNSDLISEDNVMAEARNLRNMVTAQTPLLGEENTPLHPTGASGTGFESATPRHQVSFTPNPLATPYRAAVPSNVGATPRESGQVGAMPLRTPMRDSLSIDPDDKFSVAQTPRESRMRESASKRALWARFMSLPKLFGTLQYSVVYNNSHLPSPPPPSKPPRCLPSNHLSMSLPLLVFPGNPVSLRFKASCRSLSAVPVPREPFFRRSKSEPESHIQQEPATIVYATVF